MAPRSIFLKAVLLVTALGPMLGNAQFVTLEGRMFMLDGQEFYPRVMNYGVDFACNVNGGASNLYGAAASAYDYSVPGDLECSDAGSCAEKLRRHFDKLTAMNFNTIRLLCGAVTIVSGGRKFGLTVRYNNPAWGGDTLYDLLLSSPDFNDAISTAFFAGVRNVLDLAQEKNLKVILLGADNKGGGDWTPGDDWDAVHRYSDFLKRLAQELHDHPALLAYDLWNEPRWTHINDGIGFNQWSKPSVCAITSEWYDAIREYDSNHLVTLGTSGWDDLWHWDPNVMKLDFASLHVYPEQYNVDGYSYTHMLNRVRAQIYWHGAAIPMPFIIGETSFSAEDSNDDNFDDPFNHHLVDDPAHDYPPWRDGPESQQSAYASQTMTATRAYLGSGYSWWDFQNNRAYNLTPPTDPMDLAAWRGNYKGNFYGALKYGDENANPPIPWEDKLVVGTFSTYSLPSAPSSLPTPPADYHRGKFNGSLSSGSVLGTVNLIDQDGQGIPHAVGWTKLTYSNASNNPVHEIVTNQISNDQGLLNIHRGPVFNGWYVSKYEMRVHVPGGATSPGGATDQSYQSWLQLGSTLPLARSKLNFTAEASGITVPIGQSYDLKAWSTLFVNDVTYEGNGSQGASGDLRARHFIHVSTEFHAARGSEIHIHPDNVFPDCGDPNMLVAEDNPHTTHESAKRATDSAPQLVLRFKDIRACRLRVAPNPCSDFLEVSGLPPGTPYRIVSGQGAVVLTGICAVHPIRIPVSSISPGHYTLHAESKETACSAPFVKMN